MRSLDVKSAYIGLSRTLGRKKILLDELKKLSWKKNNYLISFTNKRDQVGSSFFLRRVCVFTVHGYPRHIFAWRLEPARLRSIRIQQVIAHLTLCTLVYSSVYIERRRASFDIGSNSDSRRVWCNAVDRRQVIFKHRIDLDQTRLVRVGPALVFTFEHVFSFWNISITIDNWIG